TSRRRPADPLRRLGPGCFVALLVLLAAAGCQKNETTPRGTELFSWTSARATRRSVAAAQEIGPRTIKDVILHVRPDHKGAVRVALHVEVGPIELSEGDTTSRRTAPLIIRGKLVQNADWSLLSSCGEGPHLRLPMMVAGSLVTPEEMVIGCTMHMKYE